MTEKEKMLAQELYDADHDEELIKERTRDEISTEAYSYAYVNENNEIEME